MLRAVDSAVHSAKREGKAVVALYDPSSGDLSNARVNFQHAVARAMGNEEFLLHHKPIVRMRDGRVTGAEALLRWADPERGLVPPAEFIPLAEATGRIIAIGDWVFRRACRDLGGWLRDGFNV